MAGVSSAPRSSFDTERYNRAKLLRIGLDTGLDIELDREAMTTRDEATTTECSLGAARSVILWLLFFLILFGLGYSTLNRYDPRELGPDQGVYYNMVLHQAAADDIPFCFRLLVPEVARPFYLLAKGRIRSWNPVLFALLVSNCLFGATSAFLLLRVGLRVGNELTLALLGCTLYLLNYCVANLWLAGMVDSSEACLMTALTWALLTERWWMLPLLGVPGGMAKQSFLIFSVVFSAVWWFLAEKPQKNYRRLLWIFALGASAGVSLVLVHWKVAGQLLTPAAMALWWNSGGSYAGKVVREFTDQNFWYVFGWLLPLGVWHLHRFPRPWVMASAVTALLAVGIGGYANLMGTVNRPLFSVMGPLLSLSTASLIAGGPWGKPRA